MTTTTTTRPTEDVCPSWCSGHDDLYQAWERWADGGGLMRYHADDGVPIGGVFVGLTQEEHHGVGMMAPRVCLAIDDTRREPELTNGEAHELGMALVRAGDRLRREGSR